MRYRLRDKNIIVPTKQRPSIDARRAALYCADEATTLNRSTTGSKLCEKTQHIVFAKHELYHTKMRCEHYVHVRGHWDSANTTFAFGHPSFGILRILRSRSGCPPHPQIIFSAAATLANHDVKMRPPAR